MIIADFFKMCERGTIEERGQVLILLYSWFNSFKFLSKNIQHTFVNTTP